MQKEDNDTSVTNEDTEILNLPLYTERKADGIAAKNSRASSVQ